MAGAPLILYGPWLKDDVPTADSNLEFDAGLKHRDPGGGCAGSRISPRPRTSAFGCPKPPDAGEQSDAPVSIRLKLTGCSTVRAL